MNLNVHIDRLVVDDGLFSPEETGSLRAAAQAELAALLATDGLAPEFLSGGMLSGLLGGTLDLSRRTGPAAAGQHLARAVFAGLGRRPAAGPPSNPGMAGRHG
jgi:hypothetical protein